MMYRVVLDDSQELYGLDLDAQLLNPTLEVELNSAGTLEFTLSPFHPAIKDNWDAPPNVFSGEIDVYEGDRIIWFGRPLEVTRDFKNQKVVKCEGALAYFNDTVQRPKEFDKQWWLFKDDNHSKGFIDYIIDEHNSQVTNNHTTTSNREILLGNVTVDNDNIYRKTDYDTTADCLQQMCLDTNGGYFILRKEYVEEEGIRVAKRYLDWVKEIPGGNGQPAAFGLNLIDINQDLNGADIVSVLIPTGEDDILINNSTLWDADHPCPYNTDGNTFYHVSGSDELIHHENFEKYGRILKQKDWNDISEKSNLQQRACEWMVEQNDQLKTIECSAADLHYLKGSDYETESGEPKYYPFYLGQKIEVISDPHGIVQELPIYKLSLNLDSGVKNMTIGTPPKRELTDIVKSSGGSTRGASGTSGTSSGSESGGGSSVSIPVKDVRVKTDPNGIYKSVVKKKIAKIDLSDLGGGDVEDVQIDGTSIVSEGIANIDSSQFGTTVVANPQQSPTTDLNTIQIGNTVYDIPGGGGGSGGSGAPFTQELIFENDPMPAPQSASRGLTKNYTLDKSIDDYDAVYIMGCTDYATQGVITAGVSAIAFKKDYYSPGHILCGSYTDGRMLYAVFTDDTHIITTAWANAGYCPTLYKIYGLKFSSTIISPQIYSEEEREVGVWTDGKPLYERTIQTTYGPAQNIPDTAIATIPNHSNIDIKIINGYGRNSTDDIFPLNYGHPNTVWAAYFWVDVSNGQIRIGCGSSATIKNPMFVIRYTKTTDQPGSGTWTPKGAYTQVYSEDEILIGQWVDGKPLYQKTAFVNMPTGNYNNWFNHNISGLTNAEIKHFDYDIQFIDPSTGKNAYYDSTYNVSIARVTTTQIYFIANGWNTTTDIIIQLTLQYTKTTDSTSAAGQPNALISKTDLYDFCTYSTTEHIVGKWIDGSYIYERTWDLGSDISVSTGWTTTTIPNTGMNICIACEAVSNSGIPRANIEAQVNSGSYVNLSADAVSNPVRYITLRYTKTT